MFGVIERTLADLGHADVTFTSSNYVMDDLNKTLGNLKGELIYFWNWCTSLTYVGPRTGLINMQSMLLQARPELLSTAFVHNILSKILQTM